MFFSFQTLLLADELSNYIAPVDSQYSPLIYIAMYTDWKLVTDGTMAKCHLFFLKLSHQ